MTVDISGAWDTVVDFIGYLWTLLVQVLVEDVFLELIWNQLIVRIFITMAGAWGFMIVLVIFLWGFNKNYVEAR